MLATYINVVLLCHPLLALVTIQIPHPKLQNRQSKMQLFFFSFVSFLALRYACASPPQASVVNAMASCTGTADQPNPIASLYPSNATGTLNGTISVLPISLELARQLIPKEYGILEDAYRALLPSFPKGMYPVFMQATHDHEVQAFGFKIDDFSRVGLEFPFLDLLKDGHSSFKWAPSLMMSAGHEIGLKGARDYGIKVHDAVFDPTCEAYRHAYGGVDTFYGAESVESGAASFTSTACLTEEEPYPLEFFKNVTNQPVFADGKTCDNMIRLFNTSVTTDYGIEKVKVSVRTNLYPFTEEKVWEGSYGLRLDTAFIENNYLPCENFRGYTRVE
ncbi:hypothetical protein P154DRAFT_500369 [Amniculicola lignicola CBS 123094]|uniref:Uncharacterized protein n=1 Tax=Amniculicola lignicola CBS 123094 TaxID=1392246 RepID=A0A6A5W5H5_9PLEO|nr:hypothetical protein P154DRAFT_500369 [Amniculicola lignicola CBS 123094]